MTALPERSLRRRALLWAPVALLLGLEAWASGQAAPPVVGPDLFPGADKLLHASFFFVVGLLATRAGRAGEGWGRGRTTVVVVAGALLWGLSDEWHQSFVPGRLAEAGDVVADGAGAALAAALAGRFRVKSEPEKA